MIVKLRLCHTCKAKPHDHPRYELQEGSLGKCLRRHEKRFTNFKKLPSQKILLGVVLMEVQVHQNAQGSQ